MTPFTPVTADMNFGLDSLSSYKSFIFSVLMLEQPETSIIRLFTLSVHCQRADQDVNICRQFLPQIRAEWPWKAAILKTLFLRPDSGQKRVWVLTFPYIIFPFIFLLCEILYLKPSKAEFLPQQISEGHNNHGLDLGVHSFSPELLCGGCSTHPALLLFSP